MSLKLAVFNPSNYRRGGFVTTLWQPIYNQTGIAPEKLALRDEMGNRLQCQVDRIDPSDSSRDVLAFSLAMDICPGPEDYSRPSMLVSVEQGEPLTKETPEPRIETYPGTRGIKLFNRRLELWFNLLAGLNNDTQNWYAGSATTVLLDGREFLDTTQVDSDGVDHWLNHDMDKRCMQIDQLQLMRPAWEVTIDEQAALYNGQYQLVQRSCGPVRATFSVASSPFYYNFFDPVVGKECNMTCRLHRVVSLYAGAQYVMEEMCVRGTIGGEGKSEAAVKLNFSPRFLAHLAMNQASINHFNQTPDWLTIGSEAPSSAGYGFAADMETRSIFRQSDRHFLWDLAFCKDLRCVHLFMRDRQEVVDSCTGDQWYRLIYKPLKADIYKGA